MTGSLALVVGAGHKLTAAGPLTQTVRHPLKTTAAWAGIALAGATWVLTGCTPAPDVTSSPSVSSRSLSSPAATPTPTASVRAPATPPPAAGSENASADVTVEIRIADGRVEPNVQTVRVRAGQSVMIRGVSDVAESLHVHGYDETLDLEPGQPATLTFTADVKGVFEIETHESEKLAAKLNVS